MWGLVILVASDDDKREWNCEIGVARHDEERDGDYFYLFLTSSFKRNPILSLKIHFF